MSRPCWPFRCHPFLLFTSGMVLHAHQNLLNSSNGPDRIFKAHNCLNNPSQLPVHTRAKMRSMRSKELPEELRDRPGRGWKNILPTATPLFGSTRALFWLPGCLNKLNGEGWSSLVRAVTKNPKKSLNTVSCERKTHERQERVFKNTPEGLSGCE